MPLFRKRESHLVLHDGEVVEEVYGKDYAPDHYVEWGSITKLVTAHAVARLVREGLVEYDRPAADYIGVLPASVTVRGLVTHTSGVPRVHPGMSAGVFRDPYEGTGEEVVRAALRDLTETSLVAPGEVTYSNLGYAALGLVTEAVSGTSWFEVVSRTVTGPAGLDVVLDPPVDRRAQINGFDRRPHRPWALADSAYAAAGALWSTLSDLAAYGHQVASSGEITVPERAWQRVGDRFWHNGQTRDAGSCLVVEPDRGLVVAAHTLARLPGAADRLAVRLADQAVAA